MDDNEPIVILEDDQQYADSLYKCPETPAWCAATPYFKMWQDWGKVCAQRYQPETILLTSLVTAGAIMGRKYTGPTDLRGNLYAMSILPTGMGKDSPRYQGITLMNAVGRGSCIGGSQIGSSAGMISALQKEHEVIWFTDEFSSYMKQWRSSSCPSYIDNIKTALLEMYNGRDWQGKSLKDLDEVPKIESPHPCLMAFTQPALFSETCTTELILGGLMGRFLFHLKDEFIDQTAPGRDPINCLPTELVDFVKGTFSKSDSLMRFQNRSGSLRLTNKESDMRKIVDMSFVYDRQAKEVMKTNQLRYSLLMRSWEKVCRVALIHAWTKEEMEIGADSYEWACTVINHSNKCLFDIMDTSGGKDEHERRVNSILRSIRRKPGYLRSQLMADGKYKQQDFDNAIHTLVQANLIEPMKTKKGAVAYREVKKAKEMEA